MIMDKNIELTITNKAGVTLQNIVDILTVSPKTKKDIQTSLNTTSTIDSLLKKLEDSGLIQKEKLGAKLIYKYVSPEPVVEPVVEQKKKKQEDKVEVDSTQTNVENTVEELPAPKKSKVTKAKPKSDKTPAQVKKLNKQTDVIMKDHQITTLVEIQDKPKVKSAAPSTEEVNEEDLEYLRKELSGRLGKEVTAVLHKRNDRAIKDRKKSAQEIYENTKKESAKAAEEYDSENPYRFVLNFFTSTLNGERATPYFRRRDEYVVRSIYNKFKALCETVDEYSITAQNLPFYRVITINEDEKLVKIYHIDMNRVVRGVHTVFRLNRFDDMFLKFKS